MTKLTFTQVSEGLFFGPSRAYVRVSDVLEWLEDLAKDSEDNAEQSELDSMKAKRKYHALMLRAHAADLSSTFLKAMR